MKTLAAILITTFAFSQAAFSRDSTWLLCSNDYLVVNVFEHRDSTGTGRETALKLLYGMHTFDGLLIEDISESVTLLALPTTIETEDGPRVVINSFIGIAIMDYPNNLLLKGDLNLYGFKHPIKTKLDCKTMDGDLLPDSLN